MGTSGRAPMPSYPTAYPMELGVLGKVRRPRYPQLHRHKAGASNRLPIEPGYWVRWVWNPNRPGPRTMLPFTSRLLGRIRTQHQPVYPRLYPRQVQSCYGLILSLSTLSKRENVFVCICLQARSKERERNTHTERERVCSHNHSPTTQYRIQSLAAAALTCWVEHRNGVTNALHS